MQPPSDARAVRALRGDDARAERCLWAGRDQTTLWSVFGLHIADFPLFSPDREISQPRLSSTTLAVARRRGLLV